MPSKTILFWLSVFLLTVAIGSTCFGTDQPKFFFDLTKTLNERLDQQIQASLKNREIKQPLLKGCGGQIPNLRCGSCSVGGEMLELLKPTRSKYRLPDDPIGILTTAFQGCSNLRILTLESSGPVAAPLATVLKDDIYDGFLILRKTDSSDAFVIRLVYQALFEALQTNDHIDWFSGGSAEEEIADYKLLGFAPTIIFVFEGKDDLRVELDTEKRCAVLRINDKWGSYAFDKLSAAAIEARVKDLLSLYAAPSGN